MTPAPPSASLRRHVYPISIRLTNLQQIPALSNIGAAHVGVGPAMLDVETLAVGVEHEMPLVLGIQDGASGGPVQLSFQQSHGHLLLVCGITRAADRHGRARLRRGSVPSGSLVLVRPAAASPAAWPIAQDMSAAAPRPRG